MNRSTIIIVAALVASTSSTKLSADPGLDDVLAKRMSYVTSSFEAEGGPCKISEPKLVLDVVPSFGMYDDADNTLHITTWDKLPPEAHSGYARMVNAQVRQKPKPSMKKVRTIGSLFMSLGIGGNIAKLMPSQTVMRERRARTGLLRPSGGRLIQC